MLGRGCNKFISGPKYIDGDTIKCEEEIIGYD
jgi:hypothetical protein